MLQKMYTFIIQRGYMGSLIMLTGLAIMSFMDIKRRAVPVYMIIVMSILAIGIKIAEYIFGYKKVDVYEMFIILVVTTAFVGISPFASLQKIQSSFFILFPHFARNLSKYFCLHVFRIRIYFI
jgi:hypothetical protein